MRCPNSCGARPGSVSPVCQFAESDRPGVAPGGVTTTLTEASAGVLVPGTNSRSSGVARIVGVREPERVPDAGDVGPPLRHPGMVRRAGEPDVHGDLEPIGQEPPGERGGTTGDRALRALLPVELLPADVHGPRHRVEGGPRQRPDDAVVAQRRRPGALELLHRVAGLAAELAIHLEQGRDLVRRHRVELLLQLLDRRAGGVPADGRMDRAAQRCAPRLALGRALHDAPALTRHPRRELVDLRPRLEAADPVGDERRVGGLERDHGRRGHQVEDGRDPQRRRGRPERVERLLQLADLHAGAVALAQHGVRRGRGRSRGSTAWSGRRSARRVVPLQQHRWPPAEQGPDGGVAGAPLERHDEHRRRSVHRHVTGTGADDSQLGRLARRGGPVRGGDPVVRLSFPAVVVDALRRRSRHAIRSPGLPLPLRGSPRAGRRPPTPPRPPRAGPRRRHPTPTAAPTRRRTSPGRRSRRRHARTGRTGR